MSDSCQKLFSIKIIFLDISSHNSDKFVDFLDFLELFSRHPSIMILFRKTFFLQTNEKVLDEYFSDLVSKDILSSYPLGLRSKLVGYGLEGGAPLTSRF